MKQKLSQFSFRILLPVFLFILGTSNLFSYLKAGEFGVTNLVVRAPETMVASGSGELLKGDFVSGTFKSRYSNLGIISLRFYNQDRDSKDTLLFRLREVGSSKWFYEAKYETDQFAPHKHFPFGFPIIKDSAGRDYEFKIESLKGATGSGILVDYQTPPVFTAKSSYTKSELLHNKKLLTYFIGNKFINIFGDPEIRLNTLFFFLPLILYTVFLLTDGLSFQYLSLLSLSIIFYDTFWLTKSYDFLFFGLLFFWGLICKRFRFESRISAVFALGFLVFTPIMLIFKQDALAEKTAVWAYLFLCITVVQQVYELKKKNQKAMSLKYFAQNSYEFKVADTYWMKRISKPISNAITISLLTILSFYLIYIPYVAVSRAFPEFVSFFPSDYFRRFLFSIVLPEVVLVGSLLSIFIFLRKTVFESKYVLIIILLMFSLVSGKIISNALSFQSEPRIISISPTQTTEAWTDVVITGKNFRNLPFIGKLYIDNVEQGAYMVYWSDERVIFRTSPDLTKSGNVQIVPLDRSPSNKVPFNYLYGK